jgi:hypothetical protein
MSAPNLLPNTATARAKEMLNGRAFGIAEPLVFEQPGDYVIGSVIGRRGIKLNHGKTGTLLTLRVEEGASGAKPLAAGSRVVLTCGKQQLLEMVERFDPVEGDVVACMFHGRTASRVVGYTYSVEKADSAQQERDW